MFGKSKELKQKEEQINKIIKMLYLQISAASNKSREGQLPEDLLLKRINSMLSAGYLLGFVDEILTVLFDNKSQKKKYYKKIFNNIFPKSGSVLVESKLSARRIAEDISPDSEHYIDVVMETSNFDCGESAGRWEICECVTDKTYEPHFLRDYLITGETK